MLAAFENLVGPNEATEVWLDDELLSIVEEFVRVFEFENFLSIASDAPTVIKERKQAITDEALIDKYPARESDFGSDDPERDEYVTVGRPTELVPDPDLSREHWAVVIVPKGTSEASDLSLIHNGEEIPFDELAEHDIASAEDLTLMTNTDSVPEPVRHQRDTETTSDTEAEAEAETVSNSVGGDDENEGDEESPAFEDKYAAMRAKLDD